jgi:hypothetical protein
MQEVTGLNTGVWCMLILDVSGNKSLDTAWSITPDFSRYTSLSLPRGVVLSPCQCFLSFRTQYQKQIWKNKLRYGPNFRQNCGKRLLASSCLFIYIYMYVCVCVSIRPAVHLHGTNRLPLDRFLWNLMFTYSSKICGGNSSYGKIWQQ